VEALSSAANAVTNPGFETGALTPWVQSTGKAAAVVAANPRSGTYSLRTGVTTSGAVQTVRSLTSGGSYLLVGWARVATAGEAVAVGVKNFGGTATTRLPRPSSPPTPPPCWPGRVQSTTTDLTDLTDLARGAGITDKNSGMHTAIGYLTNKAGPLDCATALANGWPIATGAAEGACRHLIADRLDITGARWGLAGAEAVLTLRALIDNDDDFEDYLAFHTAQEFTRNHQSRYQSDCGLTA